MITIVLTNYKRLENIYRILSDIKKQNVDHEIFLLDNSDEENDLKQCVNKYVNFGKNISCAYRWKLAMEGQGDHVLVMDDDITMESTKSLNFLLDKIEDCDALGTHGVKMINKSDYSKCMHVGFPAYDYKVDIIKGRLFMVRKEILSKIDVELFDFCEDDIIISSKIENKKVVGGGEKYFKNLSEMGTGLWYREDHFKRRTEQMIENFHL